MPPAFWDSSLGSSRELSPAQCTAPAGTLHDFPEGCAEINIRFAKIVEGDTCVGVRSAEFAVLSLKHHCIYSPDWYKLALMYSQQESGISYGMNVITCEKRSNCSTVFRNAPSKPPIILIFPTLFAKDALAVCPLTAPTRQFTRGEAMGLSGNQYSGSGGGGC